MATTGAQRQKKHLAKKARAASVNAELVASMGSQAADMPWEAIAEIVPRSAAGHPLPKWMVRELSYLLASKIGDVLALAHHPGAVRTMVLAARGQDPTVPEPDDGEW